MLLSFAQFEREVTAERIRDKIAASKAKGMWMGGTPPLGYEPDGRSLKIVEEHAVLVRDIYARYLRLGNVRQVAKELHRGSTISPVRMRAKSGVSFGGVPFSRGQIYGILKSPTYIGEVHHRGQVYQGLHPPIIDRDIWNATQTRLADNLQGHRSGARAKRPSLLAGKIVDVNGTALVASHASKGKIRYRYYVTRDLQHGDSATGMRIPAPEIEMAVRGSVASLFNDELALAASAGLRVSPSDMGNLVRRCAEIDVHGRATLQDIVQQVCVHDDRIDIQCSTAAIAEVLKVEREDDAPPTITIRSAVRLTRSGRAMRLIQYNGAALAAAPNASLIKLLIKARRWWARLKQGDIDIKRLSKVEGVAPAYITRVLRLTFLAPAVVDGILAGSVLPEVDGTALTATGAISPRWSDQVSAMLPSATRY